MNSFPSLQEIAEGTVLLVDKPLGWTSFDVINKLRKPMNAKLGHAGTLDPLATGLLVVCSGKFTKRITEYQKQDKEYTGIIHLGATTPTYDLESEPEHFQSLMGIDESALLTQAQSFIGAIQQIPPIHSAIRKDGKRAYEYARSGEELKLEARPVSITEFSFTQITLPEVHFRVRCSTGTYIRSLAHDFGAALGCGGYLQALRRTKIGNFSVDDAHSVSAWLEYLKAEKQA
ncbi:MAG: tRNA pseudouridine(55) synthase TruB [Bacteroidetes bacterium]|nr:tRNA pseudouridine(55) synthase TruB [Bacteroidota bacterium]